MSNNIAKHHNNNIYLEKFLEKLNQIRMVSEPRMQARVNK